MKLRVLLLACAVAACDGDDGSAPIADAGGSSGDASPASDGAAPDDGGARFAIGVSDAHVYAGAAASVTATAIGAADATFAWTLESTPPQSAVGAASISGASTRTIAFVPDLVGDYALRVTATAAAGVASASVTVHAYAAPAFFTSASFGANGGEVAVHVAGHDGSGAHAVACAITFNSNESATYRSRAVFAAATSMDAWEASAGVASRFVFSGTSSLAQDDAGAYASFLIAGTTGDSCLSSPRTLRAMQAPAGAFGQPRFSPDGARIAYLEPAAGSFAVATIAVDGSAGRTLGPIYASPPDGGADESSNIRPEWRDTTHVAWPRPLGGSWQIVIAADAPGAQPVPYVTCAGTTVPHRIALLAGGAVVAGYVPADGKPADLFVVEPGAGGSCAVVKNLTKLTGAASRAHDFAVSPDEKTIAYLHYDATKHGGAAASGNEGELYVVPVDGSAPPAPVGATAATGRIGPRWIGSGTRLAWTRAGTPADGGDARLADDVIVTTLDGKSSTTLAQGNAVDTVVAALGPGGSCAIGRVTRATSRGLLAPIALALLLRRRRAHRAPKSAR